MSAKEEHWVAFLLTALVITATTGQRGVFSTASGLVLLAGLLEMGQSFTFGRHPALTDFSSSALGAVMGAAVGSLILFALSNRAPLPAIRIPTQDNETLPSSR